MNSKALLAIRFEQGLQIHSSHTTIPSLHPNQRKFTIAAFPTGPGHGLLTLPNRDGRYQLTGFSAKIKTYLPVPVF